MLEVLLYTTLSCQQTNDIILRMQKNDRISDDLRVELIEVMKEATPDCPWDAND